MSLNGLPYRRRPAITQPTNTWYQSEISQGYYSAFPSYQVCLFKHEYFLDRIMLALLFTGRALNRSQENIEMLWHVGTNCL